ncbi:hypothetical protein ACFQU2_22100 [Siccirubricoccus deserti]
MFLPMRRRLLRAAFLLLLAVAPAAAETTRLTFLHLNDIYEHLPRDGRGGLAEIATLIARARGGARAGVPDLRRRPDLALLASSITEGAHMIGIFNALGTDVAVLGNHEFDFGPVVTAQRIGDRASPGSAPMCWGRMAGPSAARSPRCSARPARCASASPAC